MQQRILWLIPDCDEGLLDVVGRGPLRKADPDLAVLDPREDIHLFKVENLRKVFGQILIPVRAMVGTRRPYIVIISPRCSYPQM
jgi:hypothetical protein